MLLLINSNVMTQWLLYCQQQNYIASTAGLRFDT
jgi:hypothetical protein